LIAHGLHGWVNTTASSESKAFFSEEKNHKTFARGASGTIPAMAPIVGAAEDQQSFASFLQKRRRCLPMVVS
jgi:hypothetical protein